MFFFSKKESADRKKFKQILQNRAWKKSLNEGTAEVESLVALHGVWCSLKHPRIQVLPMGGEIRATPAHGTFAPYCRLQQKPCNRFRRYARPGQSRRNIQLQRDDPPTCRGDLKEKIRAARKNINRHVNGAGSSSPRAQKGGFYRAYRSRKIIARSSNGDTRQTADTHAGEPTANYGMDAPTSGKASKGGRRRRRPRLGGDRSAERLAEDKKQRDTSGTALEREGVG